MSPTEQNLTEEILDRIRQERERQIALGKNDTQDDSIWLSIMIDYLGRASRRLHAGKRVNTPELMKAVAVGVAWIEDEYKKVREMVALVTKE